MYEIDEANLAGTEVVLSADSSVRLFDLLPHPSHEVWGKQE